MTRQSKVRYVLSFLDEVLILSIILATILFTLVETKVLNVVTSIIILCSTIGLTLLVTYYILKPISLETKYGPETIIGKRGIVEQVLGKGKSIVKVEGTYWIGESIEDLREGDEVEVVRVNGIKLIIRKRVKNTGDEHLSTR